MNAEGVRYGSARLTVRGSGDLAGESDLTRQIDRYEAGEISANDVAWAYLRARVTEHTPSFDWERADVDRLLATVSAAAPEKGLTADNSWDLAGLLLERRAAALAANGGARHATVAAPSPVAPAAAGPSAPAPASPPAAAGGAPRRSRLRRIVPRRTRSRVLLAGGLIAMVAAVPGVRYYLTEVPTQLADDYRESAEPAVERMTDAMDKTFEAFDNYLDNSTLPAREVRNAEEIDEIQRRFLPLYDDTEEALKAADRAIGKARQTLAAQRKKLGDVPSAPLLGGKPEVVAAEETIGPTERFVAESKAFLRNFQAFVDFDRKAVDLRRADIEGLDDEAITAADSLEELKAATSASLAEAEKSRERYLDLEPHPDQRKLHELHTEQVTVLVDYYSDVLEAYESLSIPALDAADAEFLASLNGMGKKESYQLQLFASNSSLQKQSRRLEEAGDRLEKRIAGLGSGEAELSGGDVYRPSAPPPPPKPGGKGDDKGSDRSVS